MYWTKLRLWKIVPTHYVDGLIHWNNCFMNLFTHCDNKTAILITKTWCLMCPLLCVHYFIARALAVNLETNVWFGYYHNTSGSACLCCEYSWEVWVFFLKLQTQNILNVLVEYLTALTISVIIINISTLISKGIISPWPNYHMSAKSVWYRWKHNCLFNSLSMLATKKASKLRIPFFAKIIPLSWRYHVTHIGAIGL